MVVFSFLFSYNGQAFRHRYCSGCFYSNEKQPSFGISSHIYLYLVVIMTKNPRTKVIVGMSGGVDSSVAAALLINQGYEVVGVILNLWTKDLTSKGKEDYFIESYKHAEDAAKILGIPLMTVEAKESFKENVIGYFLSSYAFGETPNPCIKCNQKVRWDIFMDSALSFGADFIATGHYARVINKKAGKVGLFTGMDKSKDQSYVLAGLNQRQLGKTILPLGEYHKGEVRKIAKEMNLTVAERPDSQDLCFLESRELYAFLKANIRASQAKPGEIRDVEGNLLGQHNGLIHYTIGQRKNIRIPAKHALYVIRKEIKDNVLIVGSAEDLGGKSFEVCEINWIVDPPIAPEKMEVKIRYRAPLKKVRIIPKGRNRVEVTCASAFRDITPGQFAAFYAGDEVLGGGFITS